MAALGSVSQAGPSAPVFYPGWSKNEVTDQNVRKLLVSKFTEIAASYEKRSLNKDLKSGGPWHPMPYATALKELKQKKRLDFFVSKNAFYLGYPPEGFTQPSNEEMMVGKEPCAYRIKPDCQPVQGLDNALNGRVSLIDCGRALQLAMYATVREILGDEKFNKRFSGEGKSSLCLHPDIGQTPLSTLGLITEVSSHETPELGECVYFSNIPEYALRNPSGSARGYHAVCIGSDQEGKEKKYIAFGTPSKGITEDQMHEILIQEFNQDPADYSSMVSEDLARDITAQTMYRTHRLAQRNLDVLSLQLDREGFQSAIDNTKEKEGRLSFKAGLAPLFRHFDIDGIKGLF